MSHGNEAGDPPGTRNARWCAGAIAAGRVLLGVAALVRPQLPARPWVGGQPAGTVPVKVLARGLGGRDVALGAGALRALRGARRDPGPVVPWIVAGACADTVDALATAAGGEALPPRGRMQVTLLAAGAAAAGGWAAAGLGRRR